MKVYAKNSFDRLGDDLTELIVSYLWFEDKVRLECVSKQWRRLVFNKQFVIQFSEYPSKNNFISLVRNIGTKEAIFKRQELISLLKKCPNITKVMFILRRMNSYELSLFGQYCPRLKSLEWFLFGYHMNGTEDLDFYRMYGHKLEELIFAKNSGNNAKIILEMCPNLKNVWLHRKFFLSADILDKVFFSSLENFGKRLNIKFDKTNELKILSDKYSKRLKILNVMIDDMVEEELKTYIGYICRFENLKQLRIELKSAISTQSKDCLSLIGQKCNKILKLNLQIRNSIPISDRFFDAFYEFKIIKKLHITVTSASVLSGNVECFKHCKQLKRLEINSKEITEDFFTNINIFLPKLQFIQISTENYSDSFIDSFHLMKNIQKVNYYLLYRIISEPFFSKHWFFGKRLKEVMLSPNGMNVIRVNDNCGLITYYDMSEMRIYYEPV